MTAKEYLNGLKYRKQRIDRLMEKRSEIMEKAASTGSIDMSRERVQVSRTNDRICNAVSEMAEIDEQIEQQKREYFEEMDSMTQRIRELRDVNYIQVLYKVYVQLKSFKQVAGETKHSFSWVLKWHDEAVQAFGELYEDFLNGDADEQE